MTQIDRVNQKLILINNDLKERNITLQQKIKQVEFDYQLDQCIKAQLVLPVFDGQK